MKPLTFLSLRQFITKRRALLVCMTKSVECWIWEKACAGNWCSLMMGAAIRVQEVDALAANDPRVKVVGSGETTDRRRGDDGGNRLCIGEKIVARSTRIYKTTQPIFPGSWRSCGRFRCCSGWRKERKDQALRDGTSPEARNQADIKVSGVRLQDMAVRSRLYLRKSEGSEASMVKCIALFPIRLRAGRHR